MTTQETERIDVARARTASTASASKAYERRIRRQQALEGGRLTRTGTPIASALSRVPFVAMIILLLAGGIVGVLWLNTMSDAAGLRASQSRLAQQALSTSIQAASREIAILKDPGVLAAQARSLGLVPPPGDAAMLVVGKDGKGTVIGTPTPVPAAAPPAVAALATTAAVATTAAPANAAAPKTKAPSAAGATPAATKAASPAGAKPATPSGAVKTTPKANSTIVKTTVPKTTPAKTTAAKTTAETTAAKTTAAKTTPAKPTTAGRSRQAPVTTGAGQ